MTFLFISKLTHRLYYVITFQEMVFWGKERTHLVMWIRDTLTYELLKFKVKGL